MISQCAWCEKVVGVKCSGCGSPARMSGINGLSICENLNCARIFGADEGGVTHEICAGCLETARKGPLMATVEVIIRVVEDGSVAGPLRFKSDLPHLIVERVYNLLLDRLRSLEHVSEIEEGRCRRVDRIQSGGCQTDSV